MSILQLNEPNYRILKAQSLNLQRIATDLVLDGTDYKGDNIKLWGPRPDVIRLYDTPLRFVQDNLIANWERIITLTPLSDVEAARIVQRRDATVTYQIHVLVRLTDAEVNQDRLEVFADAVRTDSPLAIKAHKAVHDITRLLDDNMHLIGLDTEEPTCANSGLVDHASYAVEWQPGVEYPESLFTITVTAERAG